MSDFLPSAYGMPNRGTSEMDLDTWNRALRGSDVYLDFMRRNNLPTDGRVQLSRAQQANLEAALQAQGFQIPNGMHIDQGGNLNQKNRLARNVAIGAGITGATLATLGAAGAFGAASLPAAATAGVGFDAAPIGAAVGGGAMAGGVGAAGWASRVPWMQIGGKATDTLFGIYANRQSQNANREALAYQQRQNDAAMAYERELEAERRRQFDITTAEQRRQWEADQAFKQAQWNASEEERLHQRALSDAKEARMAPFRAAAAQALMTGSVSPGLASLGSYRSR